MRGGQPWAFLVGPKRPKRIYTQEGKLEKTAQDSPKMLLKMCLKAFFVFPSAILSIEKIFFLVCLPPFFPWYQVIFEEGLNLGPGERGGRERLLGVEERKAGGVGGVWRV